MSMWKRSFVATTLALGDGVDVALAAIDGELEPAATELVRELRTSGRAARAVALAKAVRDIVVAIDETTLR